MNSQVPFFVTPEGLHDIVEGIIGASNRPPHVKMTDLFLPLKDCSWCHRRIGEENLKDQICPGCRLSIRARRMLAAHLCKDCKGVH